MPYISFKLPHGVVKACFTFSEYKNAPLCLILPPHPAHGGSMRDPVVSALYRLFVRHNFSTIKFNFARHELHEQLSEIDGEKMDMHDATNLLEWAQTALPNIGKIWVAGFAYGSLIGMRLVMRRPEIGACLFVTPPANCYDFGFLAPFPPIDGLIIHGNQDEMIPQRYVDSLITFIKSKGFSRIQYEVIDGANHFYNNKIDEFNAIAGDFIFSHSSQYQDDTIEEVAPIINSDTGMEIDMRSMNIAT